MSETGKTPRITHWALGEAPAPNAWRRARLDDVCETSSGGTPPRSRPDYYGGDVPWAKIEDLTKSGMWLHDTSEHITAAATQETNARVFPARTVLFAMYGSIGTVSIAGRPVSCNQAILGCQCSPDLLPEYLFYWFRHAQRELARKGRGGTQANLNAAIVKALRVPLPPIKEQERLSDDLGRALALVEVTRRATEDRLAAAESLPAAYLREVFEGADASGFFTAALGDLCELLPSKSIATTGDAEVRAITTACLSENGFLASGLKAARMRAADVPDCTVRPGEILVARSNTPELVGRAARYEGDPPDVVASDLTIRIWPSDQIDGSYLSAFLSFLFQTGYWRERAGGASGTMKKITRQQLLAQQIPVPTGDTKSLQRAIAADLAGRLEAAKAIIAHCREELDAIDALPASLLRAAFNGDS